ncbi:MAG: hypothetical protein N5P05_001340 [Chroococcopsis gigantea SAG 12.99]|jgi:Uma2 family endonuclease|nr:Uma2 family endonuclease [Chlorogloea purpurea SAG 13.99]MDV2999734.1 hypothetical protein [Chroococcopsis gigantea SAG 12.99]
MVAEPRHSQKMTVEEYLIWSAQQELRYEYIDGDIFAMTGGSIRHNDIALNFYRTLYPHIRQRGCRINVADVKVRAAGNNRYFYPDLVITCHPEDLKSTDFIEHPKIIIEVLSPSTEKYDRTKKLQYYRQIPSLEEYVLVNLEETEVEIYQRGENKMWMYSTYNDGDIIALQSIDFECHIDRLFE